MPIITALKAQKNKKRVNVYLDNKFSFGLDLENILSNSLKIGKVLTEEQISDIVKKGEFTKTYDKVLNYISVRPRSEKEVMDWFRRKKVHHSIQADIIAKLKRLKFLDDSEFAKWWVDQRITFKGKPLKIVKIELLQKGISRDILEKILAETVVDEKELIMRQLRKIEGKWQGMDTSERKQKITQYLQRKGFTWETIKDGMEKLGLKV